MKHLVVLGVLGVIAAGTAACAVRDGSSQGPSPDRPSTPSSQGSPSGDASPPPPAGGAVVPVAIMDRVLADAATRTGVHPAEISVVSSEAVTWNDGSLGCPEPGMYYTQALVDGYRLILDAGGRQLDYRTSGMGAIRLCEQPSELP